ncbi:MAG: inorganic phosphate transporter, partial [Candidatus Bathyarchaeia archaeon]
MRALASRYVYMVNIELVLFAAVAAYIAWGIGANDETMMVAASGSSLSINRLALIGALATCLGAITYGQIVEETIGKGILAILPTSRAGLQIVVATASWLTVVSYFGWPISTSHSTIGAVIGSGIFAHGVENIKWQNLNRIFVA